jgi:hypothetical protein
MTDTPVRLSPSEKQTLKHLAAGEHDPFASDWVALQHLKRLGLAEEQGTGRVKIAARSGCAGLLGLRPAELPL